MSISDFRIKTFEIAEVCIQISMTTRLSFVLGLSYMLNGNATKATLNALYAMVYRVEREAPS